ARIFLANRRRKCKDGRNTERTQHAFSLPQPVFSESQNCVHDPRVAVGMGDESSGRCDAPVVQSFLERGGGENSRNCKSRLFEPLAPAASQRRERLFRRL